MNKLCVHTNAHKGNVWFTICLSEGNTFQFKPDKTRRELIILVLEIDTVSDSHFSDVRLVLISSQSAKNSERWQLTG